MQVLRPPRLNFPFRQADSANGDLKPVNMCGPGLRSPGRIQFGISSDASNRGKTYPGFKFCRYLAAITTNIVHLNNKTIES